MIICQSLIFDLDGTLWDTSGICAEAWNHVLLEESIHRTPFSAHDVAAISGKPSSEIAALVLPDEPREEQERLIRLFYAREEEMLYSSGQNALYERVSEGLELLSQKFAIALVSNCQTEYLEAFFSSTGLKHFFADFESHGRTGLSKAENLKNVCQRSNLKKAAYVGDTEWDWEAASEAGLPFIHARYGFGNPTMGNVKSCSAAVDSFWELLEVVQEVKPAVH